MVQYKYGKKRDLSLFWVLPLLFVRLSSETPFWYGRTGRYNRSSSRLSVNLYVFSSQRQVLWIDAPGNSEYSTVYCSIIFLLRKLFESLTNINKPHTVQGSDSAPKSSVPSSLLACTPEILIVSSWSRGSTDGQQLESKAKCEDESEDIGADTASTTVIIHRCMECPSESKRALWDVFVKYRTK